MTNILFDPSWLIFNREYLKNNIHDCMERIEEFTIFIREAIKHKCQLLYFDELVSSVINYYNNIEDYKDIEIQLFQFYSEIADYELSLSLINKGKQNIKEIDLFENSNINNELYHGSISSKDYWNKILNNIWFSNDAIVLFSCSSFHNDEIQIYESKLYRELKICTKVSELTYCISTPLKKFEMNPKHNKSKCEQFLMSLLHVNTIEELYLNKNLGKIISQNACASPLIETESECDNLLNEAIGIKGEDKFTYIYYNKKGIRRNVIFRSTIKDSHLYHAYNEFDDSKIESKVVKYFEEKKQYN